MSETKEKTGQELLTHLKDSGTSPTRVEMLETYLKQDPQASATACVEWMLGRGWGESYKGTVEKAGIFAHGAGWVLNAPGVSAQDELSARLEARDKQIVELKAQLQQQQADLRRLRDRNQFLESRVSDNRLRASELNPLAPSPAERGEENKGKPAPAKRESGKRELATAGAGAGAAQEI